MGFIVGRDIIFEILMDSSSQSVNLDGNRIRIIITNVYSVLQRARKEGLEKIFADVHSFKCLDIFFQIRTSFILFYR